MRQYRASKDSPEKRAKRNEYQRSYSQSRISVKFSFEKFHETLNQVHVVTSYDISIVYVMLINLDSQFLTL